MIYRTSDQQPHQQNTMCFMERLPSTPDHRMPLDFEPTPYSVVFGRGKKCTEAIGNRRLKVISSLFLARYAKADTDREAKSAIVSEIQSIVEAACPVGPFVRQREDQRWAKVPDHLVRVKIAQVLRDCLHTKYRSSVKSKVVKRRNSKMAAKKKPMASKDFPATTVPRFEAIARPESVASSGFWFQ